MEKYFVFTGSDGETSCDVLTAAELEKRLAEDYYGSQPKLMDRLPDQGFSYWPEGGVLVIKGCIAPPVPVTKVTEWKAG